MNFFVTGGSRGIGASIVHQAVSEGHDVAFTYLGNEEGARAVQARAADLRQGARCKYWQLDVRHSDQVDRVADEVQDAFDEVNVVVNNAGINRNCLAISISDEEWAEVLDTNLTGPFYVTRAFLTGMLANRFGRVINIGSVVSKGLAGQTHYAAAKAGLYGMTRTLAKEYGPKGITVNLITPGFFKTELTEETMSEAFNKYWHTYCPLRRVGELSEISKVVTFLASDGAGFINGAEIAVTGGLDDGA